MAHFLIHPPHPGELIREDILPQYGLSVTEAAKLLKSARPNISNVLNGKAGVSPEMAIKIEAAFGLPAKVLLSMQAAYDLASAQKRREDIVNGISRIQPIDA